MRVHVALVAPRPRATQDREGQQKAQKTKPSERAKTTTRADAHRPPTKSTKNAEKQAPKPKSLIQASHIGGASLPPALDSKSSHVDGSPSQVDRKRSSQTDRAPSQMDRKPSQTDRAREPSQKDTAPTQLDREPSQIERALSARSQPAVVRMPRPGTAESSTDSIPPPPDSTPPPSPPPPPDSAPHSPTPEVSRSPTGSRH